VNETGMKHPIAESRTLRRDEGEGAVLFDPANGAIHSLNPTARRIWELCDGTRTPEEIAGVLEAEYELGPAQGREDVAELIVQMEGLGLIRMS